MKKIILIEKYRAKKCTKCSEVFPATLDFFHKDKNNLSGLKYDCKICITEKSKQYNNNHKEERKKYDKKYRQNNSEIELERKRNWYCKNKESSNKLTVKNRKIKRHTDSFYKLKITVTNAIKEPFRRNKNFTKNSRTHEILGCTFEEFKTHIENKFLLWMSWDNHGKYNGDINFGWDLDHIIPISSAKTEDEIIKLNHYTNFQPLCSKVNRDIKKDNC